MKYIKTFEVKVDIKYKYYLAISRNNLLNLKELIENYGEINCQDGSGWTPLMYAVNYKNMPAIITLIDAGADWNITEHNNRDFLDMMLKDTKKLIIKRFPDKYKYYLLIKKSKKFNL